MLHGRIKGNHCIHIQYTYKCIIHTTIIHMYRICYIICICTYCKYTVGPVVKTISTQRPPVLSDHNWTIHNVNSTTVKHLCIKTTCLERPPFTGPLGGLYIHVPLYSNYYNMCLGWSLYTGFTIHQLLQCVP